MKENKNKYYMYGAVGVISLIIILLISMIFMYSSDDDYSSEDVPVDGVQEPGEDDPGSGEDGEGEEDDDTEDVVKVENIFSMPIEGEYIIFRHYWSTELTEEEKDQATINGKTSMGLTIQAPNNDKFDVISPMSGTVIDIGTNEKGDYITIEQNDVKVIIYSLQAITKSIDDTVEVGEKIGVSNTNSFDTEAGESISMELYLKDSGVYKRTDPNKFLGENIDLRELS